MNSLLSTAALPSNMFENLQKTIGTPAERKIFEAALAELREFDQLCDDVKYPKRYPALQKRLAELGITIHTDLANELFEQQLEAARPLMTDLLMALRKERYLARVLPVLAELEARLLPVAEQAAKDTAEAEAALYARWFDSPPSLAFTAAVRAAIAELRRDIAARGPARLINFMGEDQSAILSRWFSTPLNFK